MESERSEAEHEAGKEGAQFGGEAQLRGEDGRADGDGSGEDEQEFVGVRGAGALPHARFGDALHQAGEDVASDGEHVADAAQGDEGFGGDVPGRGHNDGADVRPDAGADDGLDGALDGLGHPRGVDGAVPSFEG